MIEYKTGSNRALQELERRKRQAANRISWAECDMTVQSQSLSGFSQSDVNKRLALNFVRARAAEMLSEIDLRYVKPEDLHVYQPLVAVRGTGFLLSLDTKQWVRDIIDYTDELPRPDLSWVALKMEGKGVQERCLVAEASAPRMDDWIRFRRSTRTNQTGVHTALPFLLYEEALRRPKSEEVLVSLSKALTRGEFVLNSFIFS